MSNKELTPHPQAEILRAISDGKTKMNSRPATPDEAEELAQQALINYLKSCRVVGQENFGNYLMKMISVAAVAISLTEGSEQAANRLIGTAQFVFQKMPKEPRNIQ